VVGAILLFLLQWRDGDPSRAPARDPGSSAEGGADGTGPPGDGGGEAAPG
jgi:hypothetical protein